MGYVTTPLFNILRTNTHDYDLTSMDGLLNATKETVFDGFGINSIDYPYRDRFILGFALHYFSDEIGRETIPLWKMSLNEKLVNNGEYINQIFEKLDKQVIGEYKTHRGEHASSNQELASILENDKSQENRTYIYLDNQEQVDDADRHKADNASMKNRSASQESGISNNQAQHHGSNDNQRNNASTNSTLGVDTREGGGYTDVNTTVGNTHSGSESDSNSVAANLDTPQGSIQALRTPQGGTPASLKGAGVDAELIAPYRYLTAASSSDGTSVSNTDGSSDGASVNQHINQIQNVTNRQSQNGSDASKEIGHTENQSDDYTADSRQGSNTSEQLHNSSGVEKEHNVSRHSSDRGDAGTKLAQEDRLHESEKKGADSGNEYAEDHTFSNEMVLRSLPYMKKIWNIFDKCFLGTYEIGGMF